MRMPLTITFGRSTSADYPRAVGLAESCAGYRVTGQGKTLRHQVRLRLSLADEATGDNLHRLLPLIGGWRSARILLDGQPTNAWALAVQLTRVKRCYARKGKLQAGDGYCCGQNAPNDEPRSFGCRLLHGISRLLIPADYPGRSWFQFGSVSAKRDSFRVDKEAIRNVLETEAKAEACVLCPAFRWQRLRALVAQLPDRVRLTPDSPFELKPSEINPDRPLGIQLKASRSETGAVLRLTLPGVGSAVPAPPVRRIPTVRYADVAGQEAALAAVKSVVELPLAHPEYFQALRVQPQGGILLYGPPGNGKTLIAQAVACASQAHFECISGPEILSKWVGRSEEHLRQVFERARQLQPSVVLIDELDSIAPRRDYLSQQHEVQLIAQLLVLLDGLEERGRVATLATTNRLEAIDPAVRRPGRFDYHIEVPCPDPQGRTAILRLHLGKMKARKPLPLEELAEQTDGFSGAELAALCREAGLAAIQRGIARGIPAGTKSMGCGHRKGTRIPGTQQGYILLCVLNG